MTTTNDGGPAFPVESGRGAANGMTLRDYFAAKALQGMLADYTFDGSATKVAQAAYIAADAMLAARGAQ